MLFFLRTASSFLFLGSAAQFMVNGKQYAFTLPNMRLNIVAFWARVAERPVWL